MTCPEWASLPADDRRRRAIRRPLTTLRVLCRLGILPHASVIGHPLTDISVLPRLLRLAFLLTAVAVPSVSGAQELTLYDVSLRALASRQALTSLVDSLERKLAQPGVSMRTQRVLRADIETQRQRLSLGDFAPGDRILVRYATEQIRQDTVMVSPGSMVGLSGMPPISVRGVLWSEVENHLRDEIRPFLVNAQVSAVPLISIGVLGSVTRPGFFLVPITSPISEALMAAGGPTTESDPDGVFLKHSGRDRWDRATMLAATQNQLSLATLGARNGDVLVVNKSAPPFDRTFMLGVVGLVLQGVLIVTALPD